MDFIVGLPRTQSGFDSIWVVVDRLTKVAHFIPVKTTYSGAKLAELYMSRIVCLHGVPKKIVSIRLHESMGTKLNFSSAYHPRTDGRTKRTNQILEDMLRACAIQYGTSWDKSLPYAEFSYNNSYRRLVSRCHLFGLCMVEGAELPCIGINRGEALVWSWNHRRRRTTSTNDSGEFEDCSNRAKSYADNRRRDLEFAVGDYVYLKVSPIRGLRRFKVKGKLAPRYIGPFKIIDRKGEVAYQPELHDRLSGVHDVFHVSRLKKCTRVPEEQLRRMNLIFWRRRERTTRNRIIKMCKVKWSHHTAEEATWEREDDLRADYPELFASQS
ncbi:hypothetical protein U9M48_005315 [Paspalum notatum var. saurae]|uniref:Tf2-1-like SH3-like domain-containing protein n=1 Tax=Paspalum notatum var. saurae TaxID=547442 RepID=A0AAQ3PXB3_PASNO